MTDVTVERAKALEGCFFICCYTFKSLEKYFKRLVPRLRSIPTRKFWKWKPGHTIFYNLLGDAMCNLPELVLLANLGCPGNHLKNCKPPPKIGMEHGHGKHSQGRHQLHFLAEGSFSQK